MEFVVIVIALMGLGTAVSDHFSHSSTLTLVEGLKIFSAAVLIGGGNVLAFIVGQTQGSAKHKQLYEVIERLNALPDDELRHVVGGIGATQVRDAVRARDVAGR